MAIAPIRGKFRRLFIRDVSAALGLGTAAGFAYWYGVHLPSVRQREAFYIKLKQQAREEAA